LNWFFSIFSYTSESYIRYVTFLLVRM
jgi:hypothetical protein